MRYMKFVALSITSLYTKSQTRTTWSQSWGGGIPTLHFISLSNIIYDSRRSTSPTFRWHTNSWYTVCFRCFFLSFIWLHIEQNVVFFTISRRDIFSFFNLQKITNFLLNIVEKNGIYVRCTTIHSILEHWYVPID